jgi:hypothetical protein
LTQLVNLRKVFAPCLRICLCESRYSLFAFGSRLGSAFSARGLEVRERVANGPLVGVGSFDRGLAECRTSFEINHVMTSRARKCSVGASAGNVGIFLASERGSASFREEPVENST